MTEGLHKRKPASYTFLLCALGFSLLALALRLYDLTRLPLWYDEVIHLEWCRVLRTGWFAGEQEIEEPLFCLLLYVIQLVSTADWWVRLHSVIAGCLLLMVGYAFALRAAGRRAALWTLLVLAFAPLLVFYSRDAKEYALLALIELGVLAVTLAYRDSPQRTGLLLAYVILSTAAVYTHILAPLFLAALNITWLALGPRWGRTFFKWAIAQGVVFIASIPFAVAQVRFVQSMGMKFFWAPKPTWRQIQTTLENCVVGYAVDDWVRWVGLAVTVLAVVRALLGDRRQREASLLLLGAGLGQLAGLAAVSLVLINSYYVDRFMIGSAAALLVVVGIGLAAYGSTPIRWCLTGALLVAMSSTLAHLYRNDLDPDWLKHTGVYSSFDARNMAKCLRGQWKEGDVVWHLDHHLFVPVRWYAPDIPQVRVDMGGYLSKAAQYRAVASAENIGAPYREVDVAAKGARRIWIVMAGSPDALRSRKSGIIEWTRARAEKEISYAFGGKETIFPESSILLFTLRSADGASPSEKTSASIDEILPQSGPRSNPEGPHIQFRLTASGPPGEAKASARLVLEVKNESSYTQQVGFDVVRSAAVCFASEFDRTKEASSRWTLQPFRDKYGLRTALQTVVKQRLNVEDVLSRPVRLQPGAYDVFIERITAGDIYVAPVADIVFTIGDAVLRVPEAQTGNHRGGWNWVYAGRVHWENDATKELRIFAEDLKGRPEAHATFSRINFQTVRNDSPTAVVASLPDWRTLTIKSQERVTISFPPPAEHETLHIQAANAISSDLLIWPQNP